MGDTNYTYQYDRPPMPANWTDAERRFYVKLMDVLDDIYLRYGRIDEKLLSPKVVGRIADTEGNVSAVTQTANNLNAQVNGANGIAAERSIRKALSSFRHSTRFMASSRAFFDSG